VVTSVDLDRADAFRDEEAVQRAFLGLAERVEAGGVLLLCADDKGCAQLLQRIQQDPR
jgi:UDP-N-acetylmuramate--alanine ligase